MAFKAGEIVRMKSGGPELTLLSVEGETATCLYFSEELGEFKEQEIPLIAIESADISDEDGPEDEEEENEDEDEADAEESVARRAA
ncbi:DUF2158 domain-containing protein [Terrarubrum flagellatum]|uniref:DUF2158 domain-containing protein n=1 Tax=Terrirubrum flagellatum TaxID=2895980 RepID=UPI0031453324